MSIAFLRTFLHVLGCPSFFTAIAFNTLLDRRKEILLVLQAVCDYFLRLCNVPKQDIELPLEGFLRVFKPWHIPLGERGFWSNKFCMRERAKVIFQTAQCSKFSSVFSPRPL